MSLPTAERPGRFGEGLSPHRCSGHGRRRCPEADAAALERLGTLQHELEERDGGGWNSGWRCCTRPPPASFRDRGSTPCRRLAVRVPLARALVGQPDLLLHEPTNHLDIESMSWLETFGPLPGAVLFVRGHLSAERRDANRSNSIVDG